MRAPLVVGVLGLLALACTEPRATSHVTAVRDVVLIDGTDRGPAAGMTVLIEADRITRIGPSESIEVPPGATVIDGRGRYLIPGLWDMHVHVSRSLGGPEVLPVFLAHGVTGVRDVGSADSIAVWAAETAAGTRTGPRILQAGPQIGVWADYPEPPQPHLDAVRSLEDAAFQVRRRKGRADYIKLQDGFTPRERWLAVAAAARAEGFLLAGHVPVDVLLTEAIDAGLRSVEHTFGLPLALTDHEVELRARVMASPSPLWNALTAADVEALASLDEQRLVRLARQLVATGTALDVTLNDLVALATAWSGQWNDDPRMALLPEVVRQRWRQSTVISDTAYVSNLGVLLERIPGLVGRFHELGVMIVAGSGAGTPFTFPGSGLHHELSLLVEAGLTPMEAIQAATRNATRLMGVGDSLGTIEVGKKADLLLLDADPLADIANTSRVVELWLDGRHHGRAALDSLLESVAARHAAKTGGPSP